MGARYELLKDGGGYKLSLVDQ